LQGEESIDQNREVTLLDTTQTLSAFTKTEDDQERHAMAFRIHALPAQLFTEYFSMTTHELAERRACLMRVDENPGFPCRVSLQDAGLDETVLLINHEHQPAATPFRASHAIFVRQGVEQVHPELDEVPLVLASRLLSIRAFDVRGFLREADVVEGSALAPRLATLLEDPRNADVHLHHARQGCFAARVTRA